MHPKIAAGRVAIYARYSSELQSENSIDGQVRRARDVIERAGGDPSRAEIFPDFAISGSSRARPALESLMQAVDQGRVDVILTEDISRISRDIEDAAHIFKKLQFAGVPLIGISDGIDTSHKHAKLNFAVKSLLADMYIDDLRDKTLRGLEGRALAGFATGQVPVGYKLVKQVDKMGRAMGSDITIDPDGAATVRRIFEMYRDGGAYARIAQQLNREGVMSPRHKMRHKRFGWRQPTIRAILMNPRYIGEWRFKETQWVKVPGTNRRLPRKRPADEVLKMDRPELRIIDQDLWNAVQQKLSGVYKRYTGKDRGKPVTERALPAKRSAYLLSGIVICDACKGPLTIVSGGKTAYYQCATACRKGTCDVKLRVREDVLRIACMSEIRKQLQGPESIANVHAELKRLIQERAGNVGSELKKRRAAVAATQQAIATLVGFVAKGDHSPSIRTALQKAEADLKENQLAAEALEREAANPVEAPDLDELTEAAFQMDALLKVDKETARERLAHWLEDGVIRVRPIEEGFELNGAVYPLLPQSENKKPKAFGALGCAVSSNSSGGAIGGLYTKLTTPLEVSLAA